MKNLAISVLGAVTIYNSPIILDNLSMGDTIMCISFTACMIMYGMVCLDIVKEDHEKEKSKKAHVKRSVQGQKI